MTDQSSNFPKFYMTAPSPCPYLSGKTERKIFTELKNHDILYDKKAILEHHIPNKANQHSNELHNSLALVGFRRSQDIAYRPACENCQECKSVRVPVSLYSPTKSQKRIINKNENIMVSVRPNVATGEQYFLLKKYIEKRHADGGMAGMTADEYIDMVESSPINSIIFEYRLPSGELIGTALTDKMGDALSMVYSFFDVSDKMNKYSLGVYIILNHIQYAKSQGLKYVYLGYWVKGSPKMHYKMNFRPLEILISNNWVLVK